MLDPLICFGSFVWNPNRNIFTLPYLNHPVSWYGLLFALGFFFSYFIVRHLFNLHLDTLKRKDSHSLATFLTDRLSFFVIIGTVVGARLGHVLFYGWHYYSRNPLEIIKVWEGGLASHGGVVGILVGVFFYVLKYQKKEPSLTLLLTVDLLTLPACIAAAMIRLGNFINQEILGAPTSLPWGVIFLDPIQSVPPVPLHPVQLYEAVGYLILAAVIYMIWRGRGKRIGEGILSGIFFILLFGFRFFIEGLKLPQSDLIDEKAALLNMGQLLSLPFIVLGVLLLIFSKRAKR